jgi:hypothetical protein
MLIDGVFPSPDSNVRSISLVKQNGEPEFIKKGNKWVLSRPLFIYRDYTNSFSPNPLGFYYYRLNKSEEYFSLLQQDIPINRNGTELRITIKGYSFATAAENYEAGKIKLIIDPHNEDETDNTVFRRTIEIPFNTFSSISAGSFDITGTGFSDVDIHIEAYPSDFATVIYSIEIESE